MRKSKLACDLPWREKVREANDRKVCLKPSEINEKPSFNRVNREDHPAWGVGGGREATTNHSIKVDPNRIEKLNP